LERETRPLPFELGDHERHPINEGAANEVRQMHERCYRTLGDAGVPVASEVCKTLAEDIAKLAAPDLEGWLPNEIGFQRYRSEKDRISPHRDRASDLLFSITLTIAGSAPIRIYEPETDPPDYAKLRPVEEFLTEEGSALFLRAPGFGSGRQSIHEVLPPIRAPRLILNLRMRPTILRRPGETKWR
jgi:hypothetical protein